jgi:hypothetical protein
MGNAIVKCLQCNPGPVSDKKTLDVIEAYVAAHTAKKREKDTKLNMKKILKSF